MTGPVTWRTDDPCPVCGTGLLITEPGDGSAAQDCPLCGWAATWTDDNPEGGNPGG